MEAAGPITELVAALRAIPAPGRRSSDDELLDHVQALEELGRMIDGRRAAAAAEVEWRSRPQLAGDGLAARREERSGSTLLASLARITPAEAKRRIRIGTALAPRWSLTLEEGPARFPFVADAVRAGAVGLESARVIVEMLQSARRRAVLDALAIAERALAESAATAEPDLVAVQAQVWAMRLDPDGARPQEELQRRDRSLHLGRIGANGLSRLVAVLMPEQHAVVQAALNAHRRGITWTLGTAPDGDEDLQVDWHEASGEERTRTQYDYDAFFAILAAGIRAEQEGIAGSLSTPHEVITVIRAEDLERRQGCGYPDGILARYSIPTVERLRCGGTTRLLVTGGDGEPLHLGRPVRLFTRAQRRALVVRDGGCTWPGCTAPAAWTDAHHIAWYTRDGGRTDIENGLLLCSYHHHLIHASSRWEIRLHERLPHLVPKGWQGAPLPRHRMQRHPLAALARAPLRT